MAFYEKGRVRIHYQETGSGFPLFVIPGGGQNSTIGFMSDRAPFNATDEFKDEYRCITADLRNAPSGQSAGPLEIDRPWDSYADDHLGENVTATRIDETTTAWQQVNEAWIRVLSIPIRLEMVDVSVISN